MDLNYIRAGIFFVGGLVTIIFHKQLNDLKNRVLEKLNLKSRIKDERKSYIYTGIVFFVISLGLLVYAAVY